jgi:two-component system sensor histidine kinase ChvG
MAWAIDTKKPKSPVKTDHRWFRLTGVRPDLKELDQILDLYWGGPERRLTGITVRIIAVNATALLILMLGILYLGQYQNAMIEARLQTFKSELDLIAASISQSINKPLAAADPVQNTTQTLIANLSFTSRQRITVLSPDGTIVSDSFSLLKTNHSDFFGNSTKASFHSIQVLKDMAAFVLGLLPERETLPPYREITAANTETSPDVLSAQQGDVSLSVWKTGDNQLVLTAAAPLYKNNQIYGILLLTREGQDIKNSIGEVWLNVLKVFGITLFFTILLSIYLSGVIARPLRKLAKAAEAVRLGQAQAEDIPDLSQRQDEIGELSVVLRQMTRALWERMDATEQFAADVAHELKNPLTSLRSAFETLGVVKTEADRNRLMEIIRHDMTRLDRLITDISKASRLDAELSREAFQKLNITKLLQFFIDGYASPLERQNTPITKQQRKIQTGGVTLILNTDSESLFVWGIESRLGQVFENLISNAISFSPPGGEIVIALTSTRQKICITVEDQGPGIPPSKLETIFERFYSQRPHHEEFGTHSGLGLSICKQIIEAHGGEIFAQNIKNPDDTITGARFTVTLNKA